MRSLLKSLKFILAAHILIVTVSIDPVLATVGLAEWSLETPGGNHIGHFDPYAEHGTVVISKEQEMPKLHVTRIERWLYYRGFVAGKAEHEFFLFNEKNKEVKRYSSKEQLDQAIKELKLGTAKSKWLTPQDGWEKTWGKVKNTKLKKTKPPKEKEG